MLSFKIFISVSFLLRATFTEVPLLSTGNAQIIVSDMKGGLVRTFSATKGEGQIYVKSGELPSATYNYTLLVNGKKIDIRQMVITK